MSVHLSGSNGTAQLPTDSFLQRFMFEASTEIDRHIQILVKIEKERTLHESLCACSLL